MNDRRYVRKGTPLTHSDKGVPLLTVGAFVVGAVMAMSSCGAMVARPDGATPEARLQSMVEQWRARADLAAVTVAVDGRIRLLSASGTAERGGGGGAVTPESPFRIASVTKMFVATVVLQLVQEGRLSLSDPLSRYVEYPHADQVTIRHLLTHTSGIPDYGLTAHLGERLLEDRQRRWSTNEVLALVRDARPDFAPGTAYRYSNTGYVLLGEVIRAVTGSTWAAEVRRRILGPLRLDRTYVAGVEPVPGEVLPGYFDVDNDGDVENVETGGPWPSLETTEGPAGAMVSTAADLARFGHALFRGQLLAPATLREMVAEGAHHPRNSNYGLGLEIARPDYRTTMWGHGGSLPGFRSGLWYVPGEDLVVVVLANDSRANPLDLVELVMRQVAS